jgi:hypothetical protein
VLFAYFDARLHKLVYTNFHSQYIPILLLNLFLSSGR